MRRLFSLLVLLLMGMAVLPLSSAGADIYVKKRVWAHASWSFPTGKRNVTIVYFGFAIQTDHATGTRGFDFAGIGKMRCHTKRTERSVSISCRGLVSAGGKASKLFTMDPLMRNAHLEVRKGSKTHTVDWQATDRPPQPFIMFEGCFSVDEDGNEEEGEGQGAGLLQGATAIGHVFDKHLSAESGKRNWADLETEFAVSECSFLGALTSARPGEHFRFQYQQAR